MGNRIVLVLFLVCLHQRPFFRRKVQLLVRYTMHTPVMPCNMRAVHLRPVRTVYSDVPKTKLSQTKKPNKTIPKPKKTAGDIAQLKGAVLANTKPWGRLPSTP